MKKLAGIRKIVCISLLIIGLLSMTACSSTKLAEGYDKKVIEETAREIITDVQLRGAKVVLTERVREDFIGNFDLDTMDASVKSYVNGLGQFLTYSQTTVIGQYYEETDEDFAVILVTATYEDGEVNYTLTFDQDMTLVGFYAKD